MAPCGDSKGTICVFPDKCSRVKVQSFYYSLILIQKCSNFPFSNLWATKLCIWTTLRSSNVQLESKDTAARKKSWICLYEMRREPSAWCTCLQTRIKSDADFFSCLQLWERWRNLFVELKQKNQWGACVWRTQVIYWPNVCTERKDTCPRRGSSSASPQTCQPQTPGEICLWNQPHVNLNVP